jgi:hypothetical protein
VGCELVLSMMQIPKNKQGVSFWLRIILILGVVVFGLAFHIRCELRTAFYGALALASLESQRSENCGKAISQL